MAQTWHAAGGPPNVTILRTLLWTWLLASPKRPIRSVCDLSIVCTDGRYKYLGPRGVQTVSNKSSSWKQILLEKMPIRLGDPCLPFPRQRSNPIFVQNMLAMDTRIAFLSSACDVHSDAHRLCDREKWMRLVEADGGREGVRDKKHGERWDRQKQKQKERVVARPLLILGNGMLFHMSGLIFTIAQRT